SQRSARHFRPCRHFVPRRNPRSRNWSTCEIPPVGQRKSFLARNPNVDPKSLPEVQDPTRPPIWDDANSVAGEPADLRLRAERRARNAALLADPCLTQREATKPTPTYNLFRVCAHE